MNKQAIANALEALINELVDDDRLNENSNSYLINRVLDQLIFKAIQDSRWQLTRQADVRSEIADLREKDGVWNENNTSSMENKLEYHKQIDYRQDSIDALQEAATQVYAKSLGRTWAPRAGGTTKTIEKSRQTAAMAEAEELLAKFANAS